MNIYELFVFIKNLSIIQSCDFTYEQSKQYPLKRNIIIHIVFTLCSCVQVQVLKCLLFRFELFEILLKINLRKLRHCSSLMIEIKFDFKICFTNIFRNLLSFLWQESYSRGLSSSVGLLEVMSSSSFVWFKWVSILFME